MNRVEWAEVCQRVTAWWPHRPWPDASAAAYFDDLSHLAADQVLTAVTTLYRDGREFPPNGAHILQRWEQLMQDAPSFGDAWRLLMECGRARSFNYEPDRALAWIEERDPLVARLAQQIGMRELGSFEEGDTSFYAQARQRWESIVQRDERDRTWAGLPLGQSVGLRTVDGRVRELAREEQS